jgi:hypothetical protein
VALVGSVLVAALSVQEPNATTSFIGFDTARVWAVQADDLQMWCRNKLLGIALTDASEDAGQKVEVKRLLLNPYFGARLQSLVSSKSPPACSQAAGGLF